MQKSGKHRIFQFLTTSNNPLIYKPLQRSGCHQSVKDKNFESNSQHMPAPPASKTVVISLSKIKISKAIHNTRRSRSSTISVVISLSKIKISKAIHNW